MPIMWYNNSAVRCTYCTMESIVIPLNAYNYGFFQKRKTNKTTSAACGLAFFKGILQ